MLHSFLTSGGRPQTTLTNIVSGGNFTDTTGWVAGGVSLEAANNILTCTGDGTGATERAEYTTNEVYAAGHKIYVAAKMLVTNTVALNLGLRVYGDSTPGTILTVLQTPPVANTLYDLSGVVTLEGGSGKVRVQCYCNYVDAATQNGKVMQVQKVIGLNLTTTFGAGAEPSAAQINRWRQVFGDAWFLTKIIPKRVY